MTALEIAMAGCLAFGQPTGDYYEAITKHSGLQVVHADGAVTLRLKELKIENVECKVDGSKTTVIHLKAVQDVSKWRDPHWEPVTRDFIFYLRSQPLLKGLLTGHYHFDVQDRFSPTANQYVVGGNFLFHGQEITIA